MRKTLLIPALLFVLIRCSSIRHDGTIMTVSGPIAASKMGVSLTHEHILVDFIGADSINENRWDKPMVIKKALPFLRQIKELGCQSFVECTPAYLGRDPELLKSLSDSSGLYIITNTGYYGAGDNNKFLPAHAFSESADQLAARWITEWDNGIGQSGVKPGFIKIGVASGKLSDLHIKLVKAAARTHLKTGMTIASHTGPAIPTFEEIEILKQEGVSPEAFIWVHAQVEKDSVNHVKAARMGSWISLDGISNDNVQHYVRLIKNMKDNNLLNKVLLSHDSGWYHPGAENGGDFHGYTPLFDKLVPLLLKEGFSKEDVHQLLVTNPANAFTIRIRSLR